jgi:hypothetical protein
MGKPATWLHTWDIGKPADISKLYPRNHPPEFTPPGAESFIRLGCAGGRTPSGGAEAAR